MRHEFIESNDRWFWNALGLWASNTNVCGAVHLDVGPKVESTMSDRDLSEKNGRGHPLSHQDPLLEDIRLCSSLDSYGFTNT